MDDIHDIEVRLRGGADLPPPLPAASGGKDGARSGPRFGAPFFLAFVISLGTWVVLSGKGDVFHLSLGVVSCFIVAYCSGRHMFSDPKISVYPRVFLRFMAYVPWLLCQIFLANLYMVRLVFHPRMMTLIDPRIIRFKTRLSGEMPLLTFANSITLTPGTVTVFASVLGHMTVHVIDRASGAALPGEMERRVAHIFEE